MLIEYGDLMAYGMLALDEWSVLLAAQVVMGAGWYAVTTALDMFSLRKR
jgi:hypothetical protein